MTIVVRRLLTWLGAVTLTAVAVLAVPTAAQAATPAWPTLSGGTSGANVATAQFLLRHHGQTLTVDGFYGSGTVAAVSAFQSGRGLAADGIVGPLTWGGLAVTVDVGANSNAVRALQTALNKYGYGLTVDGIWGAATTNAVTSFKANRGLTGGTTVGATTWQWLVGDGQGGGNYRLVIGRSVLPRSEYDDPHHDYPAIDLPTVTGVTTYAITSGTISHVGGGCGYGIGISGDDGAYYQYCHLSSRSVAAGSRVSAGQVIGYTGNTGNSTGPHLHLEVRVNGGNRCPQLMLLALYDGASVPAPSTLPSTGCAY
ncbi:peptidoglycan-binding protein [Micromonospora endolithica]|uniref:Peptidoglycan-binding protein n=1 Tax=Micromonospora endolithica TaxID=230091 RepID=A0A3A9ZME8_9ACTN|nr:peptidoglycan-binding protein [Micromonospora endolithica]RKN49084.1 peptidoglycan-binding protein [Micromonospora endolithica]TWJ23235.1 putative peptidoglycan binding protein [Micromonospora endolithica]